MSQYFGLLNVNKPPGISSRQAVDRVQRLVRPAKVGHAGTLDPLASGVLVVCVGPATRLIEYVQQLPKQYRATFLLGRSSPTEDIEGEVEELANPPIPSQDDLRRAAEPLRGEIQQRPPAFSALKVGGKRAYQLARQGREVKLDARPVVIHRLELVEYDYPRLVVDIECSSGTYVRSLGRDLAQAAGTAAVMSDLVRTAVGHFHVDRAYAPDAISVETLPAQLLSPIEALQSLPLLVLSEAEITDIANGVFIRRVEAEEGKQYAAVDTAGHLVAILRWRRPGMLGPLRNFPRPA